MNYLRLFFISCFLTLGLCALINWFVDPYGMFWSPLVEGVNTHKVEAGKRARTIKPERLATVNPELALIGNSRIEMGIAAESPHFANTSVYNAGIPGIGLRKQYQLAQEQIDSNPNLKSLIISLDYLDFLYPQRSFAPENNPLNEETESNWLATLREAVKTRFALLLSIDTLISSIKTLSLQSAAQNRVTEHGTNIADGYLSIMQWEGIKPLFRQKLKEINKRLSNNTTQLDFGSLASNPGLIRLNVLLEKAQANNIPVTLFISPYHYSYLHAIKDNRHWTAFNRWKNALAELPQIANGSVTLWDFGIINQQTAEAVPLEKPKTLMLWYWEPAHYRATLGEKMLPVLLGEATTTSLAVKLTPAIMTKHINEQNKALNTTKERNKKLMDKLGI